MSCRSSGWWRPSPGSKQPLICAGGGVWLADAQEELLELAERCCHPGGQDHDGHLALMPTDHPLNMGMIGAHGNHCANKALAKADLLIMVGTRAADRAMVDPEEIQRRMATIHIDVDPAEIGKNMQAAIPLVGDVKVILRQILEPGRAGHRLRRLAGPAAGLPEGGAEPRSSPGGRAPCSPGTALRRLGARLDDDAVVCVDVGQNQIFACKYLPQKHGRLLTSGGLGTMGYALPAAMGAKVAEPERQTVVVCGDGSFQMAMNELAAIRAADMDIKIVLFQQPHPGSGPPDPEAAPPTTGPSAWRWTAPRTLPPLPPPTGSPASWCGGRGSAGRGAGPLPGHTGQLPADL